MELSNQKRTKKIKWIFNITGIAIVLIGLIFLWLKMDTYVLIIVGIFAVYVGISIYANLCYIYFSTENGKVLIRYFPVISLMKKEYDSIEFAQSTLIHFQIEKALGFADLDIVIRTKRGVAEYPTISLSALNKSEIEQIREELTKILKTNSRLKSH